MKKTVKIFKEIAELVTLQGAAAKQGRKVQEADLSIIKNAAIVVVEGRVAWTGPDAECTDAVLEQWGGRKNANTESLNGGVVIPGFVEAHTHLIFAGQRVHEFEWRVQGQTYQEISAKGGGIRHTVMETRQASEADLQRTAQIRANRFLRQGVVLLEVKSGYGLDLETELKCLKVAKSLRGPKIVTTYLGAHSKSPEVPDFDKYMEMICEHVMPKVKPWADRVDIYIEKGFFTPRQAERYFSTAERLGLKITAHVEQLSDSGGAAAALAFNPQSLDHLVFANESVIAALAKSDTTAVLLPTSDFYLRMEYPPARKMIDAGARVALSTDFNPGTSPTQDLSLVGVLARLEMKMTLPEVLAAFTVGGSYALGLQNDYGSLSVGKYADFNVLENSWQELFYSVGSHPVQQVFIGGDSVMTI